MSYAMGEITLPALTVNNGSDFTWNDPVVMNDVWTPQNPAHMTMMNESQYGLLIQMRKGGDTFWLRAGDAVTFPLAIGENGFSYVCKYVAVVTVSENNQIFLTYYSNRVPILQYLSATNQPRQS